MLIRNRLIRIGLSLIILIVLAASAFAQSRDKDYLRQNSGHFAIIYCPEDAGVVEGLWEVFRVQVPRVEQQLGLTLRDTVRFVVTPTEKEWFRVTAGTPIWANGIAYPDRGVAVLKSPRFGLPYGPLPVTAVHEYVHLLLHTGEADADFPRWFDEGLAQILAEQKNYADISTLARASAGNRLHSFSQLEMLMSFRDYEAKQGYAESLVALEFLRDRYGWSGVSNLVHTVRQGRDFDDSFDKIFGKKVSEFESEYRVFVNSTYKGSLFADTELWYSVLISLLVLVGGSIYILRRRKRLAQWQEEEEGVNPEQSDSEEPKPPYIINYEVINRNRQEQNNEEGEDTEEDKR